MVQTPLPPASTLLPGHVTFPASCGPRAPPRLLAPHPEGLAVTVAVRPPAAPLRSLLQRWPLAEEADHADPQPSTDWGSPAASRATLLCLRFPKWKREGTSTPASTGGRARVGQRRARPSIPRTGYAEAEHCAWGPKGGPPGLYKRSHRKAQEKSRYT